MKILYDDYNQYPKQDIIGTTTREFGNKAFRHGMKVIEVYEDKKIEHI